jgi:hypothetical protein
MACISEPRVHQDNVAWFQGPLLWSSMGPHWSKPKSSTKAMRAFIAPEQTSSVPILTLTQQAASRWPRPASVGDSNCYSGTHVCRPDSESTVPGTCCLYLSAYSTNASSASTKAFG